MKGRKIVVLCACALALAACAQTPKGGPVVADYSRAGCETRLDALKEAVLADPGDAGARYAYGRCLLSVGKAGEAVRHLKRATELDPGSADAWYGLGLAYGAAGRKDLERESYAEALARNPGAAGATLALAHAAFEAKDAASALLLYDRVLLAGPENREALYNRALCLRDLNRAADEIEAWKKYIRIYPEGSATRRAADHLNSRGDFSYRNATVGPRTLTLPEARFEPGSSAPSRTNDPWLAPIGAILAQNPAVRVEIACHAAEHEKTAVARAHGLREKLLRDYPGIRPGQVTARGFGSPERVTTALGAYTLRESVTFRTLAM